MPRSLSIIIFLPVLVVYRVQSTDPNLLLVSPTGETYETSSSACPFGSYFYRGAHSIDCICSKGLWVFYENACGRPKFLHGTEERSCFKIDFKIKKSLLISEDIEPSLTVLHPKDGITQKLFQNSINYPFQMVDNELIVASGEWTLEFRGGKTICVGVDDSFCVYESGDLSSDSVDFVSKGCQSSSSFGTAAMRLKHLRCSKFLRAGHGSRTCDKRSRSKRDDYTVQGRAMIPTSLAMNEEFNETYNANTTAWNDTLIPAPDEDLVNVTRDGHPLIKSQIWNYFTEQATEMMSLYENDRVVKKSRIAAFQFLDVAKDIIQKRCPTHYVPTAHFELSVGAFRAIQLRDMLYEELPITHEETERILKTLNYCKNSTNETFPFIQVKKICNSSNPYAAGVMEPDDPMGTMGQFYMIDKVNELLLPWFLTPNNREPLIETVWNIFFHAHSYCFEYFRNSAFNDHHKFTTIMMSLFSNGIQDLWTSITELKSDIYGGLIGDAVVLMHRVVHCAASARFENGTTYPWDLKRPGNITPPVTKRKKRQAFQLPRYEGNEFQAQVGCLQNLHDNSLVCHE